MDTYTYNCPNCGGKVEYDNTNYIWKCTYCGNTYKTLFARRKEIELPSYEIGLNNAYKYYCDSCNKVFVSKNDNVKECFKCHKKLSKSSLSYITFLEDDISNKSINYDLDDELKSYPKDVKELIKNAESTFKYINTSIVDGFLEIKDKTNTIKYLFMNLLIPNIENEDYRFMYEVGNNGFLTPNFDGNDVLDKEPAIECTTDSFIENNNFIDEKTIINACVNHFVNTYKVSNVKELNINNGLSFKKSIFIPVLTKKVNINNQLCNQYMFVSDLMNKKIILEPPYELNNEENIKKYRKLAKLCDIGSLLLILLVICMMAIPFLTAFEDTPIALFVEMHLSMILVIGSIIALIVVNLVKKGIEKKAKYYHDAKRIDRNEYLKQIIGNSNYVKVFRRSK